MWTGAKATLGESEDAITRYQERVAAAPGTSSKTTRPRPARCSLPASSSNHSRHKAERVCQTTRTCGSPSRHAQISQPGAPEHRSYAIKLADHNDSARLPHDGFHNAPSLGTSGRPWYW